MVAQPPTAKQAITRFWGALRINSSSGAHGCVGTAVCCMVAQPLGSQGCFADEAQNSKSLIQTRAGVGVGERERDREKQGEPINKSQNKAAAVHFSPPEPHSSAARGRQQLSHAFSVNLRHASCEKSNNSPFPATLQHPLAIIHYGYVLMTGMAGALCRTRQPFVTSQRHITRTRWTRPSCNGRAKGTGG